MDSRVYETMGKAGIVPVIVIDSAAAALPLADALLAGGLPVAEITFRTKAAAEVITILKRERPQILLGAGTVLDVATVRRAQECGAQFAVAPGLNPEVVREAQKIGLAFAPGVLTPTDIEGAIALGAKVMKFFPAEAAGGLKMLKTIALPYAHLGVRFLPLGGVTQDNMADYLRDPAVLAVGGTWIAKKDDIAAGNWSKITENCRRACEAVACIRK